MSAWESVRLRASTWPDLRVGVSASDRERPLVAVANCTLIARRSHGCGSSPRWCREDPAACCVGSEGLKQRGRQPIRRGVRGGSPALQVRALQIPGIMRTVQRSPVASVIWADIPLWSACVKGWSPTWQQCWQHHRPAAPDRCSNRRAVLRRTRLPRSIRLLRARRGRG